MSNLNTIENVIPVVDFILNNIDFYTGYNPKCGYFDAARLDEHKLFTLYDHDGDYITIWDLNDAGDRADLMTRNFMWYDIVPIEKLVDNGFMKLAEIHTQTTTKVEDNGWIKWEHGKAAPYPLTLDTIVDVKFGDGEVFEQEPVEYWRSSGTGVEGDCWTRRENIADTIIAYRVVN